MSRHTKLQQPQTDNTVDLMLQDGYIPEQVIQIHTEAGHDLSEVVRLILRSGYEPPNFNYGFLGVTPDSEIPSKISYSVEQSRYELRDVLSGQAKADWQRDNPRYPGCWQSGDY